MANSSSSMEALSTIWREASMPAEALNHVDVPGSGSIYPSSFDVSTAAQVGIGAAALAAVTIYNQRSGRWQDVSVDRIHASVECTGYFALDGKEPQVWDRLSGLYKCGGSNGKRLGWVRLHCNFVHHRIKALEVLNLIPPNCDSADIYLQNIRREDVEKALENWDAEDYEEAVFGRGGVAVAVRSFLQWDLHPQSLATKEEPLVWIEKIGDALPIKLPPVNNYQPLYGIRVLDLTRILAGPVAGRTLAAYGAEVMLANGPHLPNIEKICDTSRGKLSTHIDLRDTLGRDKLYELIERSHVYLAGYRPGSLEEKGFSLKELALRRPGLVIATLSAWGFHGPWRDRRGFDSLVQSATGFNMAEAEAAQSETPKAMPMQILDYTAGHLLAFGIQAALFKQQLEAGTWHVRVSLAGVARWLRYLGRIEKTTPVSLILEPFLEAGECGFGENGHGLIIKSVKHSALFSETPARWSRPSMPPGSHLPKWTSTD